jgi:deoxyhypusine synthase
MSKYKQIDLSGIKTISIKTRKSKVSQREFATAIDPKKASVSEFLQSLPRLLMAEELRKLALDVVKARQKNKPVILMMGAHVIKVGLSPIIIDLIKRKIVTHVAMNSAAAIHDVETAMWGRTSEDVAVNILNGKFGMARETGEFINKALVKAFAESSDGYGEALAKKILALMGKYRALSILATCYLEGIPATVHAAIGTDIVHQQPTMDGAATGEMTFRDFKILAHSVKEMKGAGVTLNIGSAVILPEVFLKALTVARNLGHNVQGFSTANFDMIRQYRPQMNVVERPTQPHGRGYNFIGHHELMIPLFAAMVKLHYSKA